MTTPDTTEGTQPVTPNRRTGYLFSEALLRDFISFQLGRVHKTIDDPNVTFIDELFHKYGADVVQQVRDWWRDSPNIPVLINYPRQDMSLPFVCVVNAGEGEKAGEQYLGDFGGTSFYGGSQVASSAGAPPAKFTRALLSIPMTHQTKIYVAAQEPTLTMYIYHVIYALLLINKIDFDQYGGIRNLVMSGGDIEHHPELFPDFAYFKIITLTYDSNFDVPLQQQTTIGGIDASLSMYLQQLTQG